MAPPSLSLAELAIDVALITVLPWNAKIAPPFSAVHASIEQPLIQSRLPPAGATISGVTFGNGAAMVHGKTAVCDCRGSAPQLAGRVANRTARQPHLSTCD
eukprot:3323617-Prymnesium_polylepis.1